jgi:type II secretory pathway pseudopilin PulG
VRTRRSAYTLLEVILVATLLAIFAAVSVPTISTLYSAYKVRAAADAVRAGYANARSHAIEESRRYRSSYLPNKGNYRVAPDAPEYWSGNTPPADDNNPAFVFEGALPGGIRFTPPDGSAVDDSGDSALEPGDVSPGQYVTGAVFESDGSAQADVSIVLQKPGGGPPLTVSLRGLTGTATVRKGAMQ